MAGLLDPQGTRVWKFAKEAGTSTLAFSSRQRGRVRRSSHARKVLDDCAIFLDFVRNNGQDESGLFPCDTWQENSAIARQARWVTRQTDPLKQEGKKRPSDMSEGLLR